MDIESEIEHRRALAELAQVAVGSENEHLARRELRIELFGKRLRLRRLHDLAQLREPLLGPQTAPLDTLVTPMGGHAALGYLVHPFAADLYFDPTARIGDDRRMQRFVSVRLRNRYPIAHTVRIGRIEIGHDRVDTPALRLLLFPGAIDDDPDREQVVHLVEADAHPLHLAPDRVDRLGAALQVIPDALRPHLLLDRPDEASDELLALGGRLGDPFLDIGVIGRLEVLQRDVLQFRLDAVQSQLMRDLRIEVQALPRLLLPLLLGKYVEDAHHLEPVGQLDQNDPGIGRIRDDQLAEIVDLVVGHLRVNVRYVAQPLQNADALLAEAIADLVDVHQLQPHDIVQQRRDRRVASQPDLPDHDHRRIDRMRDQRRAVVAGHALQTVDRQTQRFVDQGVHPVVKNGTSRFQKRPVILRLEIDLPLNFFHVSNGSFRAKVSKNLPDFPPCPVRGGPVLSFKRNGRPAYCREKSFFAFLKSEPVL